jgi:hypothetical protein
MAKGQRSETTRGLYGSDPEKLPVSNSEFTGQPPCHGPTMPCWTAK